MFERIKKQIGTAADGTPVQKNATIRVIGDRASGKTTYMAALARFPQSRASQSSRSQVDSSIKDISANNDNGETLIAKAQNILEQGLELEPTDLSPNAENAIDYQLTITLGALSRLGGTEGTQLNVGFKDYAGEFFSDLLKAKNDPRLESYLADCGAASGIMFLMDGSAQRKDAEYAQEVEAFFRQLSLSGNDYQLERVALVLTKCELPDLWIKRDQPALLAQQKFKQVCETMRTWQSNNGKAVEFFTSSAFGVMGEPFAEPNSKEQSRDRGGVTSVLKISKRWKPFGLVAPIYWLCTGDRSQKLDEE